MLIIKAEAMAGDNIYDIAQDMVQFSQNNRCGVEIPVNGIRLVAFPMTSYNTIVNSYFNRLRGNRNG